MRGGVLISLWKEVPQVRKGVETMKFWLMWLGRLIAAVALFKLTSASFKFGLSTIFKNAIALYEQTVYPLISPITYIVKSFGISVDKDFLVIIIALIGVITRAFLLFRAVKPDLSGRHFPLRLQKMFFASTIVALVIGSLIMTYIFVAIGLLSSFKSTPLVAFGYIIIAYVTIYYITARKPRTKDHEEALAKFKVSIANPLRYLTQETVFLTTSLCFLITINYAL
jgi:hypothetical protein